MGFVGRLQRSSYHHCRKSALQFFLETVGALGATYRSCLRSLMPAKRAPKPIASGRSVPRVRQSHLKQASGVPKARRCFALFVDDFLSRTKLQGGAKNKAAVAAWNFLSEEAKEPFRIASRDEFAKQQAARIAAGFHVRRRAQQAPASKADRSAAQAPASSRHENARVAENRVHAGPGRHYVWSLCEH